MDIKNPFSDFGKIVYGERFIGRKEILGKLENRTFRGAFGNFALIGLPRIGKSSLAWNCLMTKKERLKKEKIIVSYINVSTHKTADSLFLSMCQKILKENDLLRNALGDLQEIYDSAMSRFDGNLVMEFFEIVNSLDIKVIFILDEFDAAHAYERTDFQFLRELSYNPETNVCLVTCSKNTIAEIEVRDGAISNFVGIFEECWLPPFTEEDVKDYWKHFELGWSIDDEYKKKLFFYTGNHPFLMDYINNQQFFQENPTTSLNDDELKLKFMDLLDEMVSTLTKDKVHESKTEKNANSDSLLNAAIQLVVGPYDNVSPKDLEKLLRYGFLKHINPKEKEELFWGMQIGPIFDGIAYSCFSDYSTLDFYRRYHANVPYHALWNETENLLRDVVRQYLRINYQNEWEMKLRAKIEADKESIQFYKNNKLEKKMVLDIWAEKLTELKKNRDGMIRTFRTMEKCDLINFTNTNHIFELFIRRDKKWFIDNVFKKTYEYWNPRFKKLQDVRNPVAHNNPISEISSEIDLAREYCEEIKQAIIKWKQKNV